DGWADYAKYLDTTRSIGKTYDKIRLAQAQIAANRYLNDNGGKPSEARDHRFDELQARSAKAADHALHALFVLRAQRVQSLLAVSPHRTVGKFFAQYS